MTDTASQKKPSKIRTRFAPSPTGYMHIGNLRTALYTWLIAKHADGTFILRIEDTDKKREVEGAVEMIYKTLRECGLTVDEGPVEGGPAGPYIQSERAGEYRKYAELLIEKGGAYRCFCERCETESRPAEKEDAYSNIPCPCRDMNPDDAGEKAASGEPFVIRQKIPGEGSISFTDAVYGTITTPFDSLDDQVLLKSDGLPTYNFANVIDDHLMGITHVVRGSEYLSSAPKYNLLYESFGWDVPTYVHCPPVMRDEHHKMSKRSGDPSYEDLRGMGFLTEAILNYVALLGWSPRGELAEKEFFDLQELREVFDTGGISKSPAIFDMEKLRYFNAAYIRKQSLEEFHSLALPWIRKGVASENADTRLIASLLKERCEVLSDIPEKLDFVDHLPEYDVSFFENKKSKTTPESSLHTLRFLYPLLSETDGAQWTADSLRGLLCAAAEREGVKNASIMWPLRIAVSGRLVTPGGAAEIAALLGKEETLRRVRLAVGKLENS